MAKPEMHKNDNNTVVPNSVPSKRSLFSCLSILFDN